VALVAGIDQEEEPVEEGGEHDEAHQKQCQKREDVARLSFPVPALGIVRVLIRRG
jgi:hypothetical protein